MNHSNQLIHINDSNHSIIIWILIGLIAGYLTGRIMRGAGFGPIVDIIVGIIGAIIGGLIMITLGYAGSGGFLYTVFVAVIGAIILTCILRLLSGRRL